MQNSSSRKSFIEHNVEKEDILYLIYDLIEKDYLQPMEQGGLIIGLEGEKIINNYEFYAVFPSEEEWIVMHESEKIGHVEEIHYAGEEITVAGFNWLVVGVDPKRMNIFVKPMPENFRYSWPGDRALTHDRILQRMKRVLAEDTIYPYLGPNAAKRLQQARELAHKYGFDKYNLINLDNGLVGILPWMGHRNFRTLQNILSHYMKVDGAARQIGARESFYMILDSGRHTAAEMLDLIKDVFKKEINPYDFIREEGIRAEKKKYEYKVPKYDCYIPDKLLRKQVIMDYIDIPFVRGQIAGWTAEARSFF